jgi:hypothetical protein
MKRIALFLMFLCLPSLARAQQKKALSAASATCTTTSCLSVTVDQTQGGATFTISANPSGNAIQFEASGDGGSTVVAISATPSNSSTSATSTASTGTWQVNTSGYTNLYLRMSTLVGGTTTVSIIQGTPSARGGSGGGGGAGNPAAPNTSVQFNNAGSFGGSANLTYTAATGALTEVGKNSTFGTPFTSMSAYAQAQVASFAGLDAAGKFGISATNMNGLTILYDGTSDGLSPGEALNSVAICGVAIPTSAGCGGVNGYAYVNASSTLAEAWGISGFWQKDGAGTLTDAYGLWATTGIKNTGTVTRNSGVFISDQHGLATTNYGLRIEDQGTTSDAHAILSGGQETHTYGTTAGANSEFPFDFRGGVAGDLGDGTPVTLRISTEDAGNAFGITNRDCAASCGYTTWSVNSTNTGALSTWDGGSNYPNIFMNPAGFPGRIAMNGGAGTPANGDLYVDPDHSAHTLVSFTSPRYLMTASGNTLIFDTAPTVSSGFGTGASVTVNNGTAAFRINVGTSNTGTGIIGLPTAATGWNCFATDITTTSTTVSQTKQKATGSDSSHAALQNYTDISGTGAWTDSDILAVSCFAY